MSELVGSTRVSFQPAPVAVSPLDGFTVAAMVTQQLAMQQSNPQVADVVSPAVAVAVSET